jgi:hypothetical protein
MSAVSCGTCQGLVMERIEGLRATARATRFFDASPLEDDVRKIDTTVVGVIDTQERYRAP